MSLLVYGVVDADRRLDRTVEAAAGGPVQLVTAGAVAAVVGDAAEGTDLTEDDAVRHLDVLVALVTGGPVLPVRFGTVAPDAEAVRQELLAPAAAELRRGLDAVQDLVEVRLDAAFDENVAISELARADPGVREAAVRHGTGDLADRIEVGRYVAESFTARRADRMASWTAQLSHLIEETTTLPAPGEATERIAFLVRRDRLADLDGAVTALAVEVGAEAALEYVGPLPVTSFATVPSGQPGAARTTEPTSAWGW